MPKLHELQERRAHAVSEMRGINEAAEKASRDYTADEDKRHKDFKTEIAGLDRQIERARDLQDAERAAPAILHSGRLGDGRYEERARQFSVFKMVNAACGENVDIGFEREKAERVSVFDLKSNIQVCKTLRLIGRWGLKNQAKPHPRGSRERFIGS